MTHTPVMAWILFVTGVVVLLLLDLLVFHRRAQADSLKVSLGWTVFWMSLALSFNGALYLFPEAFGIPLAERSKRAMEFFTAYVIEQSLSVDNLFVFLMIFTYFHVPKINRHRVLFWGILGAVLMRFVFILAGIALIHRFEWIIYVFGVMLIYSGIKMARHHGVEVHPENNPVLRLLRRFMPIARDFHGESFFVNEGVRMAATPLFVALVMIEASDVVFAVDSIPAVLGITTNPFIAFTSNVCAVLGLRALFFALAGLMGMFRYLHYGLVAVLIFVGCKMMLPLVVHLAAKAGLPLEGLGHVPTEWSLGIIGTILLAAIVASVVYPEEKPAAALREELEELRHGNPE